jgi:hypothetical protein
VKVAVELVTPSVLCRRCFKAEVVKGSTAGAITYGNTKNQLDPRDSLFEMTSAKTSYSRSSSGFSISVRLAAWPHPCEFAAKSAA